MTSKHVNNDIGVIMDSVWNGKAKREDWMGRFVQKSLHAAASGYEKEKKKSI